MISGCHHANPNEEQTLPFPWYCRGKDTKKSEQTEPGAEPSETGKISSVNQLWEACSAFSMCAEESSRQWFVFRPLGRKYKAARIQKSKDRGVRLLMLLWVLVTASMRSRFGPTNFSWVETIMTQGCQVFVHSHGLVEFTLHAMTACLSSPSVGRFLSSFGISLCQTQGQLFLAWICFAGTSLDLVTDVTGILLEQFAMFHWLILLQLFLTKLFQAGASTAHFWVCFPIQACCRQARAHLPSAHQELIQLLHHFLLLFCGCPVAHKTFCSTWPEAISAIPAPQVGNKYRLCHHQRSCETKLQGRLPEQVTKKAKLLSH